MSRHSLNSDLQERLVFLGIDDAVRESLRASKTVVGKALPTILDGFYKHVQTFPQVSRFFKGQSTMDAAKSLQIDHWSLILSADFNEHYVASVRKIGQVHNRIGLEPRWYIGGYNFITCGVVEAVSNHLGGSAIRNNSSKRNAWLTALNRAVMLDMDFAISVYLEEGKRERKELLETLAQRFEAGVSGVITEVSHSTDEMQANSRKLMQIAEEAKEKAMIVATSAEETSQTSASVASASEELSSAIREISQQIQKSTAVTENATSVAESVNQSMAALLEQTNSISKVSEYINGVAGQINLLALNATIESARAGEAGKGFAVVASEVKNLAGQTTKASEEIGLQVQRILQASTQTE